MATTPPRGSIQFGPIQQPSTLTLSDAAPQQTQAISKIVNDGIAKKMSATKILQAIESGTGKNQLANKPKKSKTIFLLKHQRGRFTLTKHLKI
jgi:hypothetical protein